MKKVLFLVKVKFKLFIALLKRITSIQHHQTLLTIGSSKSLFVGNDGGNVCEVFFMLLHGPGMGRLVYSTKYKFLFKLTQLMKYLSFLGLDNKFSLKYSPYLVGIQAKFF